LAIPALAIKNPVCHTIPHAQDLNKLMLLHSRDAIGSRTACHLSRNL
jgi:hypothetical protein